MNSKSVCLGIQELRLKSFSVWKQAHTRDSMQLKSIKYVSDKFDRNQSKKAKKKKMKKQMEH